MHECHLFIFSVYQQDGISYQPFSCMKSLGKGIFL